MCAQRSGGNGQVFQTLDKFRHLLSVHQCICNIAHHNQSTYSVAFAQFATGNIEVKWV